MTMSSASSRLGASAQPAASRAPAISSESDAFIWQPRVQTWKLGCTAASVAYSSTVASGRSGAIAARRSSGGGVSSIGRAARSGSHRHRALDVEISIAADASVEPARCARRLSGMARRASWPGITRRPAGDRRASRQRSPRERPARRRCRSGVAERVSSLCPTLDGTTWLPGPRRSPGVAVVVGAAGAQQATRVGEGGHAFDASRRPSGGSGPRGRAGPSASARR